MHKQIFALLLALLLVAPAFAAEPSRSTKPTEFPAAGDWPWWRGPQRNGAAAEGEQLPREWAETENILWKAPVPGRGHGSPTVVGNQVFLAAAQEEEGIQSVLCFAKATGEVLWKTEVHRGNLMTDVGNKKATQASSTVACDGEHLFVNFLNNKAMYTTALSREGKLLWQTKVTDYQVHQGYGSSPAIYGSVVIVSADNKAGGAIAGLDRTTGKMVWKHNRPKQPNYASPIVLHAAGRNQLVFIGCDLVSSYEPETGKLLWEFKGATTECVTSTVTDGNLVYTSGGYPKNHLAAMHADGSGKIAWENNTRLYVPSLVIRDEHLYAVTDGGIATCWEASTGKELWKERLGGTFTASAVLVGEQVLAVNEEGQWFIFEAKPQEFKLVAKNTLGDEVFGTPVVVGNRIYARVAHREEGKRQEYLYAIGGP